MRALRVVGITGEDGNVSVVLEDPDRRERYTVPGDETLRAAARGDLTRLGQIAIEVGNELRPREIQARIRAGASVAELAAVAGVSEQKIERFAYPVLLERSRTADLARLAHPLRADGPDRRTLGEVVADTFELRGQAYDDALWDSWKGEDGRWVVALAWTAGRSDNRAHWTFQPGASGGTVTALDEHASDLVEGLPVRPLRTIGEVIDLARADETTADVVAETPRRAEPRGETAPARRIEHRRAEAAGGRAEHAEQHRAEPGRAEPPRAEPGRAEPGATAAPPETGPARPPSPAEQRPAATSPAASPPPSEDEQAATPQAPRRSRKGKPVMPSWDEVLLGVKGQR
ncbi:MAG: septation protein SepH [Pseudonocardia sp.]